MVFHSCKPNWAPSPIAHLKTRLLSSCSINFEHHLHINVQANWVWTSNLDLSYRLTAPPSTPSISPTLNLQSQTWWYQFWMILGELGRGSWGLEWKWPHGRRTRIHRPTEARSCLSVGQGQTPVSLSSKSAKTIITCWSFLWQTDRYKKLSLFFQIASSIFYLLQLHSASVTDGVGGNFWRVSGHLKVSLSTLPNVLNGG